MMTELHQPGMRRLTPAARLWLWTLLLSLCMIGGGFRVWQNHQRRAAMPAINRSKARIYQLWSRHFGVWTATELADELSEGGQFVLTRGIGEMTAIWADSKADLQHEFLFALNDKWLAYASDYPTGNGATNAFDHTSEEPRRWISAIAPVGWVYLLLHLPLYRRVIAELMLATALIAATAWLVDPKHPLIPKGIFSNHMLFWAVVMLVISGTAVAKVHLARVDSSEPLCPVCEYNLTGNTSGRCPECGASISCALQK